MAGRLGVVHVYIFPLSCRLRLEGVTFLRMSLLPSCGWVAARYGSTARERCSTKDSVVDSKVVLDVASLCQEDRLDNALLALVRMDQLGMVPSVDMYKQLLQACAKRKGKALAQAKQVHAHLVRNGLELDTVLGDFVVTTLVNCGSFADGFQLFQRLSHRTVHCWTAIISAYVNADECQQALSCYQKMQEEGVEPNQYTFVSLLRACSKLEDLEEGRRIHSHALKLGFESDVFVGSISVSMYAKCGSIMDAQQVFDRLPVRNVVSWNAMLAAYAQQNQGEKAWHIYERMLEEGVRPDSRTFVSALQSCGLLAENEDSALSDGHSAKVDILRKGKAIHAAATARGFDSDVFLGSTLVSMYAKCGSIMDAQQAFDCLSQHNVVSWNALLSAYAQQNHGERALEVYSQMQNEGVQPDAWTFVSALNACGTLGEQEESALDGLSVKVCSLRKGKEIHAAATASGFRSDIFLCNTLVTMYAKCGSIMDAEQVFNTLSERNVVSWNAMLAAYAQQGQGDKALETYLQMQEEGVRPDTRTFVSALQGCASLAENEESTFIDGQLVKAETLKQGKRVHAAASVLGFDLDVFVNSSLVSMYAKCGSLLDAQGVFDKMPVRNVVSWSGMISAFIQHEQGEKALQIYGQMLESGVQLEEATYISVLEACSSTGALGICEQTHRRIVESGLECSLSLATSLIHAYGKCGSMADAQRVFDSLSELDVVSWTALMAGYSRLGLCEMSMKCYDEMCGAGLQPNRVTFLALLSACSHAGMVEKGVAYFESMTSDYGIPADLEHYACVIDVVGRAGLLEKAEHLLSQMPMQPDLPVWLCLLSACRKHGNLAVGRLAFDGAIQLEPRQAAAYVLMSSMYADAGMSHKAKEIDELRRRAGAWKEPGRSWIEHEKEVHSFLVGDRRHKQEAALYELLEELRTKLKVGAHCLRA